MTPKIWNSFVPRFSTIPSVNQVECNPYFQQKELRKILDPQGVRLEAWYPLGHGDKGLLANETVVALAKKYGKNAGQVILRFENQEGIIVFPKSTKPERIKSNMDIFDFELAEDEMEQINSKISESENTISSIYTEYAAGNKIVHELIDLALLQNGMLKGEALAAFIRRSVDLI